MKKEISLYEFLSTDPSSAKNVMVQQKCLYAGVYPSSFYVR